MRGLRHRWTQQAGLPVHSLIEGGDDRSYGVKKGGLVVLVVASLHSSPDFEVTCLTLGYHIETTPPASCWSRPGRETMYCTYENSDLG